MTYEVTIGEKIYMVDVVRAEPGWQCRLDGKDFPLDVSAVGPTVLSLLVNGRSYEVKKEKNGAETQIAVGHQRFTAAVRDPRSLRSRRSRESAGHGVKKLNAPMPGKVVRILAAEGTSVEAGQGVLVIEAMKMQNELKSPKKGIVKKIYARVGAAVEAGQPLAEVE
jgi:biotin carboxyl carrier protein